MRLLHRRAPRQNSSTAGAPSAPAVNEPATTTEEIDFERFEGIGVPARIAWMASAVLYGTASMTFGALALATTLIPRELAYFAAFGTLMSLLCLVGAKRFTNAWWGGHFRSATGMMIVIGGAIAIGDVHSATSLVMLYPMLVTAYLYDARRSIPYVTFGTLYFATTLMVLVPDPTAHAIATATVIAGISAVVVRSQQELRSVVSINRDLSVTDALTGAANVRRLREQLSNVFAEAGPDSRIALFAMDLDDFKRVNDEFSHTRGDSVLKAVSAEIEGAVEPGDLVARRGGDEFAVLVPDARDRDLDALTQQIRDAIRRARNRICPEVNPNGSVAFAIHTDGESVDQFLERCDDALHESKLDAHPERRFGGDVIHLHDTRRIRGGRVGDAATRADHRVSSSVDAISEELNMARSIQHALGTASSWNVFSILSFACGLAIAGAMATRTGAELTSPLPLAAAIGLYALGGLSMLAARCEAGRNWMHLALVTMLALNSVVVWSAGPLSAALADLFIAPAVCAVYAFSSRLLLPHLVAGLGLFVAALAQSNYEYTVARVSVTAVIMLVLVGMLAKARRVTHEFTENAVRLSTVDPLTGATNLRGMRRGVADAIERCGRGGQILALVSVDLDEFKQVNDVHSHTLGDRMLVDVAAAMRTVAREQDVVSRRGGDEFAVICTIEDEHEIPILCKRLGDAIVTARAKLTSGLTVSASIGSVVWRRGEDADTFLARADEELHGAKADSHARRTGAVERHSA
ncbi:MAG: GGDEF domain-containing protein [Actinobacteria bacterium]|nr:GGDEF domain-containing protein [Actinomycetota bacterium]